MVRDRAQGFSRSNTENPRETTGRARRPGITALGDLARSTVLHAEEAVVS
jgi:hypothetical protein